MKKILVIILIFVVLGVVYTAPNIINNQNDIFDLEDKSTQLNISKTEMDNNLIPSNSFIIAYDNTCIYFGTVDKDFKIFSYDLDDKKITSTIYTNSRQLTIAYTLFKDEMFYVGEVYFSDENIVFELKRIDKYGNDTILMSRNVNKIPYINANDEYIFVNYSMFENDQTTTYLEMIDFNTFSNQIIDKRECKYNEDSGLYDGEIIMYCGGFDDILYYEVVSLQNERLETEGKAIINCYSIKKNAYVHTTPLSRKVQFVSGNESYMIISEYDYNLGNEKTGKICTMNANEYIQDIPDISPGFDIQDCSKLDNGNIVMYNGINYYIFDLDKQKYFYVNYNKLSGNEYSSLKFFKNSIGYIETSGDKVVFCKIDF